ncbi:HesB/IscA family protein [Leptolyngbya sp. BL0902]|uniref:HesB/IscA family protein n=1 Tax=Leptolyngbya sp. BL0902 TaxID=1115757 RepID=UPI0018E7B3B1|nr:iron-sulfur cluster assembly accessory protein [Leptolyngbya sp. BL0902]
MIHLRPAAAQEIQRLLQSSSHHHGLRIHLQPSDCAEWSYDLSPAQGVNPDDTTFQVGALQIVMAESMRPLLNDLTIDYAEDLMGGGFRFINPQARQTCGCGNAFSVTTTAATVEDCHAVAETAH